MKLLLVDDQNVVRETLANALTGEEGIDLVIQAEGAKEAITLQQRHRFDVAVIELSLADRTGTELIRELKTFADTRVLVLSICRDEFSVGEAMRAGADGYLSKRSHLRDLVDAIRTVARGRTAVSSDVSAAMVRALHRRESPGAGDVVAALSERERQVLRLLALGSSAKEVAAKLAMRQDGGDPSGPPLRQGGHPQRRRPHPTRRARWPDRSVAPDLAAGERCTAPDWELGGRAMARGKVRA